LSSTSNQNCAQPPALYRRRLSYPNIRSILPAHSERIGCNGKGWVACDVGMETELGHLKAFIAEKNEANQADAESVLA
jgi:hypothetical protein